MLILERPIKVGVKEIKLRLDSRMVIPVSSRKTLEGWCKRYPNLEVLG